VSPPHFIFSEGEVIRLISKQTVDEILARSDIESLIGSYVTLKRAGSNLKGLCPFHNEKSPSFTVYTADNSFYCFGCGIGGNAITFVRQMEHLDYPSAIEFLAKRAGINVVHENEGEYKQKSGLSKERLLKMNVDAAKFFHGMLDAGIYLGPSQFEAAFISAAHTEEAIDLTIEEHLIVEYYSK